MLMAFEAKLVKHLCWSHMMVLRPKPSGGHRTIGLAVALLRVLSRLRRPLAQSGGTNTTRPISGGARARRATARRGRTRYCGGSKGAAAVGGFFVTEPNPIPRTRRPQSSLGRRSENKFSEVSLGLLVRFMRKLAVPRGRQVRHISFLGL